MLHASSCDWQALEDRGGNAIESAHLRNDRVSMSRPGIEAIAHAYGSRRCDNAATGAKHGFDADFVRNKIGIETRYERGPAEATSDLAIAAGRTLLERSATPAAQIECLVVVTQTPDYQLPHTSALVQHALGLPPSIPAFDVGLGCSGFVYGLDVASAFMAGNGFRLGMLITADAYSSVIDPADRATAPLFSDAASATLLGERPLYRLGRAVYGTDGSGADRLIVKGGGSRSPSTHERLFMDGRAIFNFMMTRVPISVRECLERNAVREDQVDRWVFHQASQYMLESLATRMKLARDKVVMAMRNCGNTVASSIPIALEKILAERHGTIVMSGFGVGLSWATNVLRLEEA